MTAPSTPSWIARSATSSDPPPPAEVDPVDDPAAAEAGSAE